MHLSEIDSQHQRACFISKANLGLNKRMSALSDVHFNLYCLAFDNCRRHEHTLSIIVL